MMISRMIRSTPGILTGLWLSACADQGINPPTLADKNPHPRIVEVDLQAEVTKTEYKAGVSTTVWSYNGIVPGPTIEANLGDTLVVNFTNNLPEDTTVHWHGMEVPATMDGSSISQKPVPPGGTFRYEFKLLRASTYWYHPHIRGNRTIELGLQGMLIVHDRQGDAALGLPRDEHHLVLDDVLLTGAGKVADEFPAAPAKRAAMQVNGREGNTLLVNGRAGQVLRVPRGVPQRLRIVNTSNSRFMRLSIPGAQLWRIGGDGGLLEAPLAKEAIGTRPVAGHGMPGMAMPDNSQDCAGHHSGEGGGMMPMDMPMPLVSDPDLDKGVMLTPGERADMVVVFSGEPGEMIPLEWHDHKRGRHSACLNPDGSVFFAHVHDDGKAPPAVLMNFQLSSRPEPVRSREYEPPQKLSTIPPIDSKGAAALPIIFGHGEPDKEGNVSFFVTMEDGKGLAFKEITPAIAPVVKSGDVRILEVHNLTMGDHNFHLHGFFFQHVETEYINEDMPAMNRVVPAAVLENKDTIIVPARPGMVKGRSRTITRLAVRFDDTGREGQIAASGKEPGENESGGWLFHCHILDHAARGMANFLQVVD